PGRRWSWTTRSIRTAGWNESTRQLAQNTARRAIQALRLTVKASLVESQAFSWSTMIQCRARYSLALVRRAPHVDDPRKQLPLLRRHIASQLFDHRWARPGRAFVAALVARGSVDRHPRLEEGSDPRLLARRTVTHRYV